MKTRNRRALTEEEQLECARLRDIFATRKAQARAKGQSLTQQEVGEACGWSSGQSTVNQYITGKLALNLDALMRLSRVLDFDPGYVSPRLALSIQHVTEQPLRYDNVDPVFRASKKPQAYPVVSWIAAGNRAQSPEQYVPGSGLAFESDQNAGEFGYWLEVRGNSMTSSTSPTFLPGTYVLVQPEGFDLVSGKYYIAQHRDGETTFKQYVYDAGRAYLAPLNPSFETIKIDDDWHIIGRVIDVKITGL